ncbi:Ras GTPase [Mortierella sp. AM989]|nr:Ras GTPase [Mortierella sp. AM989]
MPPFSFWRKSKKSKRLIPPIYKLIVLGARGVGKSALLYQLIYSHSSEIWEFAFEDNFRKLALLDEETAILDIYEANDFLGHKFFQDLYLSPGEGFMMVYSTTSRKSFDRIPELYQKILLVKGNNLFPIILVATKSDRENEREISAEEGRELAERLKCHLFETSSKLRINVDEPFYALAREIRDSSAPNR